MDDTVLEEILPLPLYRNQSRVMLNDGSKITLTFQDGACSITKTITTKNKKTRVVIVGYNKSSDTYSVTLEAFSEQFIVHESREFVFHVERDVVDSQHICYPK